MTDWKKKIDDEQEVQNAERLRRDEEAKEKYQKAEEARIEEFGRKFKCHICNKPARDPAYTEVGWDADGGTSGGHVDWSRPGDLYMCSKCKKWTCDEHIYRGTCQKCAEKM